MSKHTPGPWKAEQRALNFIDITHSNLHTPGAITHALCRVQARQTWIEEATANAHLISAAPDLLSAIEKAMHRLQFANKHIDCQDEIDACVLAIAKATGQP